MTVMVFSKIKVYPVKHSLSLCYPIYFIIIIITIVSIVNIMVSNASQRNWTISLSLELVYITT